MDILDWIDLDYIVDMAGVLEVLGNLKDNVVGVLYYSLSMAEVENKQSIEVLEVTKELLAEYKANKVV
jgi:hypothetical protein